MTSGNVPMLRVRAKAFHDESVILLAKIFHNYEDNVKARNKLISIGTVLEINQVTDFH